MTTSEKKIETAFKLYCIARNLEPLDEVKAYGSHVAYVMISIPGRKGMIRKAVTRSSYIAFRATLA